MSKLLEQDLQSTMACVITIHNRYSFKIQILSLNKNEYVTVNVDNLFIVDKELRLST
jgi:hypothetical protein